MAINKIPESASTDEPVLYTPPGAAPRGLRSDPFVNRDAPPPQASPDAGSAQGSASGPRDWDFAMPAPAAPRQADPHIDPDINWRRHVGLRPPPEPAGFPETSRERFNENWERLAAEPPRRRHSKMRRSLEQSACTRWLFTHGRLDLGYALGALLLIGLLGAALFYGTRVLTGSGKQQHAPVVAPPASGK